MCSLTWREPWRLLSILKVQEASSDSQSDGSVPHGRTSWEPRSSQTVSTDLCSKRNKGAKAPTSKMYERAWVHHRRGDKGHHWQSHSSHRRQDSTRPQRTPKVHHREDSSLLSSFALDDPQRPCPRMTLCLDCAETPAGKLRSTRAADVGAGEREAPWEDLRGDWQERAGVRLAGLELSPLILTGNLTFSES